MGEGMGGAREELAGLCLSAAASIKGHHVSTWAQAPDLSGSNGF